MATKSSGPLAREVLHVVRMAIFRATLAAACAAAYDIDNVGSHMWPEEGASQCAVHAVLAGVRSN